MFEEPLLSSRPRRSSSVSLRASAHHISHLSLLGDDTHGAGIINSIINLAAAILGAGLLGLPYGFAKAGMVTACCFIGLSAVLSTFTMHLLSIISRDKRIRQTDSETGAVIPATFYRIAEVAFPSWCTWAIEMCVILNCLGLATSYLVVVGSTMPYVVGSGPTKDGFFSKTSPLLWLTIGFVGVAPLAFAPSLDALNWTSSLGILMVVYTLVIVILYFDRPPGFHPCSSDDDDRSDGTDDNDDDGQYCGGEVALSVKDVTQLQMLSIAIFANTAHVQQLSVSNELRAYTQARMDTVTVWGVILCNFVYVTVGFCGYLTYGDEVTSNLLLGYPDNDPVIIVAQIGIVFLVMISYPLMCTPARDSGLSIIRNIFSHSADPARRNMHATSGVYYMFTIVFLTISYILGMSLVENSNAFAMILGLLGATCSTTISFIVPTYVYAKLFPEPHMKRRLAWAIFYLGVCLVPVCTTINFI